MNFIFYMLMMLGCYFQLEAYSLERFEGAQSVESGWNEVPVSFRGVAPWKHTRWLVGMLKQESTDLEAASEVLSSAVNLNRVHRRSIYEVYFQRERIDPAWVTNIFNDVQNFSEWHRAAVYAAYAGRQDVEPAWVRTIRNDIEYFEDEACKDYVNAALQR